MTPYPFFMCAVPHTLSALKMQDFRCKFIGACNGTIGFRSEYILHSAASWRPKLQDSLQRAMAAGTETLTIPRLGNLSESPAVDSDMTAQAAMFCARIYLDLRRHAAAICLADD